MLEALSGSQAEINAPCGALVTTELGNCVEVAVAVLGSPSQIAPAFSVDIRQH